MEPYHLEYEHPENLVETEWLEKNVNNPKIRIFDCSVFVVKNENTEQAHRIPFTFKNARAYYEKSHIPNANFINILNELTDNTHPIPLMLPSEEKIIDVLGTLGINDDTHVILYSTTEPNWATRVWWILHSLGFDNVAVLNGGWSKWVKENRPTSTQEHLYESCQFTPRPRKETLVSKEDVLAATEDNGAHIVSALPSPIYNGISDITFGRKGRIRKSLNIPFTALHDPDTGCYLPANQLEKVFNQLGANRADRIISYCGGGVAASNEAFALHLMGYENLAVYDGSMFEWGNDDTLPMECANGN